MRIIDLIDTILPFTEVKITKDDFENSTVWEGAYINIPMHASISNIRSITPRDYKLIIVIE